MHTNPNTYAIKMSSNIVDISAKKHKIYVQNDLAEQVNHLWFSPDYWHNENAIVGESSGRNTAYFIDALDKSMVLRRYYRGGLMAKLSKDSYLFTGYKSARASAEMIMLKAMHEMGLPVPRPIAAIVERTGLFYCKNAILIERIENAVDAFQSLAENVWTTEMWFKLGQLIRRFHVKGVYHSDMNIHNILLDNVGNFWLIDFDKCEFRKQNQGWQQETLNRLKRSLLKEQTKHPEFHFQENNWQSLLNGYNSETDL